MSDGYNRQLLDQLQAIKNELNRIREELKAANQDHKFELDKIREQLRRHFIPEWFILLTCFATLLGTALAIAGQISFLMLATFLSWCGVSLIVVGVSTLLIARFLARMIP